MKNYMTTVKCKGLFHNKETDEKWTSKLCSVKVAYNPETKKITFIRVYRQQSKNSDKWIHPHFNDEQFDVMRDRAEWNYETFINNNKDTELKEKKESKKSKHHIETKCERCIELRRYCK